MVWKIVLVNINVINWAASSEFVSSSIPSWQILTAHAQPFRGARDLAFCLKVPHDSLLVWCAWTFAARICDKYQNRLTRPNLCCFNFVRVFELFYSCLICFFLFFKLCTDELINILRFIDFKIEYQTLLWEWIRSKMAAHHLQLLLLYKIKQITYRTSLQGINIIEIYSFLKVILNLNQTLYHVFLFQNNFYFYHDIQAVSFNKVKGVEPNWF